MKRIGLISETHGFIHPRVSDFFRECDEIWHAGDIGNIATADQLSKLKPFKAVYGNIDGSQLRISFPEHELFYCEEVKVLMIHIGGYPGRYNPKARKLIEDNKPKLFISGHSHILKVMPDKKHKLLHINPGAAGNSGLHKSITMVRFVIDKQEIKDLEVLDIKRK
ncbi:MAG: YfcE family phosphodiesterase [Deltaproteobacteria bacterium]|nr:MAG: YfcE family phosphodiesterase [Deltaproteobacteria bacterium]